LPSAIGEGRFGTALGGSIVLSGIVLSDVVIVVVSFDWVGVAGFCGATGRTEEIGPDNVCILSQGIGAAAGAAFSSGDIFAVGASGACIACAIASDDSRSICLEVLWTLPLPARKYQH
jgi:hypothetical protein